MSAGRSIITLSQSWGTPQKYVKAVKDFFGGRIHLDPCSNEYSIVKADKEYRLPEHDGLKESWNYRTIFVNPPYGIDKERGTTIKNWLAKCAHANTEFDSEVLALIPIAANTSHWKRFVFTKAKAICFLYDTRLKFLENGSDSGKGAPMACAMIYWGDDFQRFYDVFIEYGAVVDISNLIDEEIGTERKKLKLFQ
jgi:DNA N-6-adenine-methyltransferase (Dam)